MRASNCERKLRDGAKHEVELAYITSRGRWYHVFVEGRRSRSRAASPPTSACTSSTCCSGCSGRALENQLHVQVGRRGRGYLELEHARVRWFLSIDAETLPDEVQAKGQRTYRSIQIDGEELEFSEGFTDLHTASYRDILSGGGFGLEEARAAITLVHDIREAEVLQDSERMHPLARQLLSGGPRVRPMDSMRPGR